MPEVPDPLRTSVDPVVVVVVVMVVPPGELIVKPPELNEPRLIVPDDIVPSGS